MKDYLNYMQEVLGVQQVMLRDTLRSAAEQNLSYFSTAQGLFQPGEIRHFELVFLNICTQEKESLFRPEVQDLFSKMKSAMKLKNIQVLELNCSLSDRSLLPSQLASLIEARLVVVLSSFPQDVGELIFKGPALWLETYSPAYLLEDVAAKKVVWNDLQKVMKELGL